jgi:hypothetical protein
MRPLGAYVIDFTLALLYYKQERDAKSNPRFPARVGMDRRRKEGVGA